MSIISACTFVDSLYICTHPVPDFALAACAAASDEVRTRPCQSLTNYNGTVRMSALQIVTNMCRYAANPLLMSACASARDGLMTKSFRGFHSAALIMSELMLTDERTTDSQIRSYSCLQRYDDRGLSEVRHAAARVPPCRVDKRHSPFHTSGFTLVRRAIHPSETNAAVGSALKGAAFVHRYAATIAQVQSSSAWLPPFERLQTAYVETESMESTGSWRDHMDDDNEVHLYAWTKLRGHHGVTIWAAPFDRISLMCAALEETRAPPPIRRFVSKRQYLDVIYEHIACPVQLDAGQGILLSRGLPHKVAEEADGVGARVAWRG